MLDLTGFDSTWMVAIALNSVLAAIARVAPKQLLTPSGLLHAWALGVILWVTLGWRGYVVVLFYFAVGSAVTRVGMAKKEAAGIAEGRSGMRGPENVWGSALTGALCALAIAVEQDMGAERVPIPVLLLAFVASFSTKLSDTTASEVGKAYGKRTFLITTLKPVPPGTEGAVSLEGTLAGIGGSIAIALVGWGVGLIGAPGLLWCAIAAFVATTIESLIGATLQARWGWLTNEVVNGVNTAIGAIVAAALALLL